MKPQTQNNYSEAAKLYATIDFMEELVLDLELRTNDSRGDYDIDDLLLINEAHIRSMRQLIKLSSKLI